MRQNSQHQHHLQHLGVVVTMIALAIATRLIPHPWNVTAVTAVALFGGATLRDWRMALIVPLSAIWLSDLVLNNFIFSQYFEGFVWWHSDLAWTYAALALTVLLGRLLLARRHGVARIAATSVSATTLFFVLSNFGVWASGVLYPISMQGLLACYIAAIPFYGQQLAGDLGWCALMFGSYAVLSQRLLRTVPAPSRQSI